MPRISLRPLLSLAVLLAGACAGHAAETDAAPKPGGDPAGVAAELLATDSGFAAAGRDLPVVEALAPMLADDVEMPAPGGFIMGRDSVLKALKANPLNTTAHFHWTPVRVGVSADGRQGFTFGYGSVVSGDSTATPLKYLAYWVKGSGGWHAVAYKRGRASGPADPTPMDAALPPNLVAAETDPARIEAFRQSLDTAERAF
ncbi:MAG TPA: nuclear transport factor 2 family protein, partial [Gemmatimonadales bacterium]|nr:nuclear transport factor 2 family protein [Gemmatimonadales bacterium]